MRDETMVSVDLENRKNLSLPPATGATQWAAPDAIKTFYLIIFTVLWSILLSFIPVFVNFDATDNMYVKDGWYNAADIIRFIEPIGGMPLNLLILFRSGFLTKKDAPVVLFLFTFAGTVYVQGAAFHSASVMFKNAVEKYDELYNGNRYITDLLYWIRTVWEHIISHYLYVAGYAVFVACIAWVFKDHQLVPPTSSTDAKKLYAAISTAAVLYAILIAGVAINFPSGTIVGLIYFILYGLLFNGYLLHKSDAWSIWQRQGESQYAENNDEAEVTYFALFGLLIYKRPILFYYFSSHIIAILILILWIGAAGGFYSRSQA